MTRCIYFGRFSIMASARNLVAAQCSSRYYLVPSPIIDRQVISRFAFFLLSLLEDFSDNPSSLSLSYQCVIFTGAGIRRNGVHDPTRILGVAAAHELAAHSVRINYS